MSILTSLTLGIAFFTPPVSGPNCTGLCVEYPYLGIISRFPRDYFWMYPAMLMMICFVVLMVSVHYYASTEKKTFSMIALAFSLISASAIIIDYYIQVTVIQPSLINGESDGIAILCQYNPHGIFIALEEIGYIMMSLAFLFAVPVFSKKIKTEKTMHWVFITSFSLAVASLIIYSLLYGIMREYRFEVAIITINFITLIITGILLSKLFKRSMNSMLP
jgi:predicted signal transduction protein with EAL and GGDEF domain